eukprot:gene16857-19969_t
MGTPCRLEERLSTRMCDERYSDPGNLETVLLECLLDNPVPHMAPYHIGWPPHPGSGRHHVHDSACDAVTCIRSSIVVDGIDDIDSKDHALTLRFTEYQDYHDARLSWNANDYCNLTSFHLDTVYDRTHQQVWTSGATYRELTADRVSCSISLWLPRPDDHAATFAPHVSFEVNEYGAGGFQFRFYRKFARYLLSTFIPLWLV